MSTPGHDYIVVGAGSSGCVVASRLAQKTDARVLLIEAGGGAGSPMINMPMGFAAMIGAGAHNWSYRSDAEPALDQRGVALPRGRVLGGCSSINGMVYIRGQRQDFDGWAAQGNAGWDHASVLPLFKKSEDNWRGAGAFHGAGGELHIRPVGTRLAIADRFIEAAQQQGIPANADFNADVQDGVGYFDANIAHGVRQHTARAFLRPALRRPNLQVMKHAVVRRVLLRNGRAVGVQVLHDGQVIDIGASTEVILCAGPTVRRRYWSVPGSAIRCCWRGWVSRPCMRYRQSANIFRITSIRWSRSKPATAVPITISSARAELH
uniref:GMC family oxidoreductase n=1 Tax=Rhodanobacter glycinis TaxID=582702 RepID=UPI00155B08B0|nr:GMC family oxidoreductase N-terminal domain-containing protein [Rhodanobacter glycinis]